jgi:hypothetical protein
MHASDWLAVGSGVALATTCGLRAFLPLLAAGIAARFGLLALDPRFAWLAGNPALIALGVATVLEIAGDKIPLVDHLLDVAGTFVRPALGVVVMLGVLPGLPGPMRALLAMVGGAGALSVHVAKAHARIGSTAVSAGHANPLISLAEDGVSLALVVAGVFVPLVALLAAILVLVVLWRRRERPMSRTA